MPKSVMIVLTNPVEGQDDIFADWYNNKHLKEVAGVPGTVSATRYRVVHDVSVMEGMPGDSHKSLAIYELEAQTEAELEDFTAALNAALQAGKVDVSPSLDTSTASSFFAIPVSDRVTD